MEMTFFKYQGTGNDFIMLDGINSTVKISVSEIQQLCNRRFGIGADGLIILKPHSKYDFEMDYYNADGSQSFCGNGSRCAQAFAKHLGLIENQSIFLAIDGVHHGRVSDTWFETKMGEVSKVESIEKDFFIDTGSPHHIVYVEDIDSVNVEKEGAKIRYSDRYKLEGSNVNFVEVSSDHLKVRTYERGVEGETYSCGTGVTAVAISYAFMQNSEGQQKTKILTKGGELAIKFDFSNDNSYQNIWLCGPAKMVYKGEIAV